MSSLQPCSKCNRKFAYDRLETHENICRGQNKVEANSGSVGNYSGYNTDAPPMGSSLKSGSAENGGGYETAESAPKNPGGGLVCEICGKLFGTQSLPIHQQKCRERQERDKKDLEKRRQQENRPIQAMPGVICYICGRRFGKSSLHIHEPQCLEKWHVQNNQLEKGERKKPPVKPQINVASLESRVNEEKIKGSGAYNLDDAYNEAMLEANKQNMEQCPNCGRRFNSDRLAVHLNACKPGKAAQRFQKG